MDARAAALGADSNIVARRWLATWIDLLLLGGTSFLLLLGWGLVIDAFAHACLALIVVGWLAYYVVLEGRWGWTVGKHCLSLRVVDRSGQPPGLRKALIRTAARLVEVNPVFLGGAPAGLFALLSPFRQRIGDMIADTYVLTEDDLLREAPVPWRPSEAPPQGDTAGGSGS